MRSNFHRYAERVPQRNLKQKRSVLRDAQRTDYPASRHWNHGSVLALRSQNFSRHLAVVANGPDLRVQLLDARRFGPDSNPINLAGVVRHEGSVEDRNRRLSACSRAASTLCTLPDAASVRSAVTIVRMTAETGVVVPLASACGVRLHLLPRLDPSSRYLGRAHFAVQRFAFFLVRTRPIQRLLRAFLIVRQIPAQARDGERRLIVNRPQLPYARSDEFDELRLRSAMRALFRQIGVPLVVARRLHLAQRRIPVLATTYKIAAKWNDRTEKLLIHLHSSLAKHGDVLCHLIRRAREKIDFAIAKRVQFLLDGRNAGVCESSAVQVRGEVLFCRELPQELGKAVGVDNYMTDLNYEIARLNRQPEILQHRVDQVILPAFAGRKTQNKNIGARFVSPEGFRNCVLDPDRRTTLLAQESCRLRGSVARQRVRDQESHSLECAPPVPCEGRIQNSAHMAGGEWRVFPNPEGAAFAPALW